MVSLIDTDVMIDLSRENAEAAGYLDSLSDPAISIVAAHELIVGARDKRDLYAIDSPAIGLTHRRYRDQTELHTRQQEQEALRNDRRSAA